MQVCCVWEHNGPDTLLYAANHPGAFTRGASLAEALEKMPGEIRLWRRWAGWDELSSIHCTIVQEANCALMIRDADSDVLFNTERPPLCADEYGMLKNLALQSARDFQLLYESVPDHNFSILKSRQTFYSQLPRTAQEMYDHTRSVNAYYFGEIGVDANNEGTILSCRERGFELLEKQPAFLANTIFDGSYGELWTLRKVLRRFIWHDRIHAKAMWRMARRTFPKRRFSSPFPFE